LRAASASQWSSVERDSLLAFQMLAFVDRAFDCAHCQPRIARDLSCQSECRGNQIGGRDQPVS